jgi:tyrosyl-tRNA synthetase
VNGAFDTLKARGFVAQCSNEAALRDLLDTQSATFYCGFDPTGSSLHVGHLVQLMAMAHLQRAGHRPIALIGGGTARIGDPSGKTEMRKMLSVEDIKKNAESFRRQIGRFLDFSHAVMVDNAEWLAALNYIDFLREIGRHFSVNRMLSFEAYKQRLEKGLSFIEFNYQLLQSYDFLILNERYDCLLQIGGNDQWGNIVSGMELVRRIKGKEVFALTSPLITRSDGKKMGKTEAGALYLDEKITNPYEFYQYWVNVPDADVRAFLLLFTFLPIEEIDELAGLQDNRINRAKEVLAHELTSTVHGAEVADQARETSRAAFGERISGELSAMPTTELPRGKIEGGMDLVTLLAATGLCRSKSEARRLIDQGGAYINDRNIRDTEAMVEEDMVENGIIMLRAGKKRYHRVVVKT